MTNDLCGATYATLHTGQLSSQTADFGGRMGIPGSALMWTLARPAVWKVDWLPEPWYPDKSIFDEHVLYRVGAVALVE